MTLHNAYAMNRNVSFPTEIQIIIMRLILKLYKSGRLEHGLLPHYLLEAADVV